MYIGTMAISDREKCEMILDEMDSLLVDIGMQWDTRHYSSESVSKKVGKLQESVLEFKFFYRKYIERCEKESKFVKDIEERLKKNE